MPKRNVEVIITDMIDQILAINEFTNNVSKIEFLDKKQIQYAVDRAFEILGESCKQLPEDFIAQYTNIEWHKIISFRNLLIHEYFRVDRILQWNIIQKNLPELLTKLTNLKNSL